MQNFQFTYIIAIFWFLNIPLNLVGQDGATRFLQGKTALEQGKYQESINMLHQAQANFDLSEDWNAWTNALIWQSEAFRMLHKYEKSDSLLNKIDEKFHQGLISDLELRIRWIKARGNLAATKGDFPTALKLYQQGLDSLISPERIENFYFSLNNNLALINYYLGNWDTAIVIGEKSLDHVRSIDPIDEKKLASGYNNLGIYHEKKGDIDQALFYYEEAHRLNLKVHGRLRAETAGTANNLGIVYDLAYQFDKSLFYYNEALEIKEKVYGKNHPATAWTRMNIAGQLFKQKNPTKALSMLQIAEKTMTQTLPPDHDSFTQLAYITGEVLMELGRREEALQQYQKGVAFYKNGINPNHIDINRFYNEIANTYMEAGEYDSALLYNDKIIALLAPNGTISGSPFKEGLLSAYAVNARAYFQRFKDQQKIADLQKAHQASQMALHCYDTLLMEYNGKLSNQSLYANGLSTVYSTAIQISLSLFELTEERKFLEKAFVVNEQSKSNQLRAILRNSQAKVKGRIPQDLLQLEQKLSKALIHAEQEVFEATNDTSTSAIEKQENLFQLRLKYDSLIQQFEIQYPEYHRLKYELNPVSIQTLQDNLKDNEAIISYFWGKDEWVIFKLTPKTLTYATTPIEQMVETQLDSFLKLLHSPERKTERERAQLGYALYQKLMQPIAGKGLPKSLIVIPDGKLGYLPFDVLLSQAVLPTTPVKSWPYLIEKHSIRFAYSATTLFYKQEKDLNPTFEFVGFAPGYPLAKEAVAESNLRDFYPPLRYNQKEIGEASELWEGKVFLREEATETHFKEFASLGSILHLALHATVHDSLPMRSGMVFQENADSIDDGFLHLYELFDLPIQAELVILSACNTGFGKHLRGEGIQSMARVFAYAGCPNVVMSLWQADDQSSQEIMLSFHTYLREGLPKQDALRLAKLDYLHNAPLIRKHPFYWSHFMLVGDNEPLHLSNHNMEKWLMLVLSIGLVLLLGSVWKIKKSSL